MKWKFLIFAFYVCNEDAEKKRYKRKIRGNAGSIYQNSEEFSLLQWKSIFSEYMQKYKTERVKIYKRTSRLVFIGNTCALENNKKEKKPFFSFLLDD